MSDEENYEEERSLSNPWFPEQLLQHPPPPLPPHFNPEEVAYFPSISFPPPPRSQISAPNSRPSSPRSNIFQRLPSPQPSIPSNLNWEEIANAIQGRIPIPSPPQSVIGSVAHDALTGSIELYSLPPDQYQRFQSNVNEKKSIFETPHDLTRLIHGGGSLNNNQRRSRRRR